FLSSSSFSVNRVCFSLFTFRAGKTSQCLYNVLLESIKQHSAPIIIINYRDEISPFFLKSLSCRIPWLRVEAFRFPSSKSNTSASGSNLFFAVFEVYSCRPNNYTVGDLDGDGEYKNMVKWGFFKRQM